MTNKQLIVVTASEPRSLT